MGLREQLKNWGMPKGSVGARYAVLLATALVCSVQAAPPNAQPGRGEVAATRPAENPAAQNQGVDELKRLIEQKMQAQGNNSATQPANPGAASSGDQTAGRLSTAKPYRAALDSHSAASAPTTAPAGDGGQKKPGAALDLTPAPPDQPQPRWVCELTTAECRPVWQGDTAKFVFPISNSGEGALNMNIKGCCGSKITGATSRTLQPGQRDEIELTLTTKSQSGEFTRKISIQTNDPNNPQVELVCKGRVLTPFLTDPRSINFGAITRDSGPVTRTITLKRGDGGRLSPKVASTEANVSAELREIEPGEKYEVDITVSPPWPNDKLRGSFTVETGLPEAPKETVHFFGTVQPRLRAEPTGFVLPRDNPEQVELRAALVWTGEPGKALSAVVNDSALRSRIVEEGGQQVVVLTVPAGYETPKGKALSVAVTTDDTVAGSLRIAVSTTAAGARDIARPAELKPGPGRSGANAKPPAEPTPRGD